MRDLIVLRPKYSPSFICFESQRDLELTKCCAALSKCRKSRVIIDTHLGFKKRYSLHGLASQVTYRLRDEMAHAIAAENRIVSLLATCYQNQIESVLTSRASYRVALLDEDSVARNKIRRAHPCLSTASSTMLQSISRVVLSFRDNLGSKKHQGPASGLLSHLPP